MILTCAVAGPLNPPRQQPGTSGVLSRESSLSPPPETPAIHPREENPDEESEDEDTPPTPSEKGLTEPQQRQRALDGIKYYWAVDSPFEIMPVHSYLPKHKQEPLNLAFEILMSIYDLAKFTHKRTQVARATLGAVFKGVDHYEYHKALSNIRDAHHRLEVMHDVFPSDEELSESEVQDPDEATPAGEEEVRDGKTEIEPNSPQELGPEAQAEDSRREREVLHDRILDNWGDHDATVPEHLPDNIHPADGDILDWPIDLLQAIAELSDVTRNTDVGDIRTWLQGVYTSKARYSERAHAKAIKLLQEARTHFDKGKQPQLEPPQTEPPTTEPQTGTKTKRSKTAPPTSQPPPKSPKHTSTADAATAARPIQVTAQPQTIQTNPPGVVITTAQPDTSTPDTTPSYTVPAHLSAHDKQCYRLKVFELQNAYAALSQAECDVTIAKSRRNAAALSSQPGASDAADEDVCKADKEVQRLKRVVKELLREKFEIGGVVDGGLVRDV
jgi:hypothetical protein